MAAPGYGSRACDSAPRARVPSQGVVRGWLMRLVPPSSSQRNRATVDDMDGKHEQSLAVPAPRRQRSHFGASLILIAAVACYATYWHWLSLSQHGHHHQCHDPDGPSAVQYPGEHIAWDSCGDATEIGGRQLECSSIDVPMDQFDKSNSGDKTFYVPLIRLRGNETATNLLINPGGPGGSGAEFIHRRGEQLSDIVGDGFHLLSFDPRGVNQSRPLASCYPTDEARREYGSAMKGKDVVTDSAEMLAWSLNYVQACHDTMGEHGGYINTPQTAADMNSILDAVGQEQMAYWGFSYGTLLGQTYASLFPERSDRVIVDAVTDLTNWYTATTQDDSFTDSDRVLEGFADECIKAGATNCSLAELAETADELETKLYDFGNQLKEQPLNVYINSTMYGLFTYNNFWYDALFPAMYKPPSWYGVADILAKLLKGNATEAFLAYSVEPPFSLFERDESTSVVMNNDMLSGTAHWPKDSERLLDSLSPMLNSSVFAPSTGPQIYARQNWVIEKKHDFVPPTKDQPRSTRHPLLVLSSTYDPICPLKSARGALDLFEGSRLVTVKSYGHASVAVPSECLGEHVRNYLYRGELPEADPQCEMDGAYFIKPE